MASVPSACLCPGSSSGRPPSRYRLGSKPLLRRLEAPTAPTEAEWHSCACLLRYPDRRNPRHVGSARQEGTSARSIATTLQSLAHTLPDRCLSHRDGASAGEKSVVRCPRVLRIWR